MRVLKDSGSAAVLKTSEPKLENSTENLLFDLILFGRGFPFDFEEFRR